MPYQHPSRLAVACITLAGIVVGVMGGTARQSSPTPGQGGQPTQAGSPQDTGGRAGRGQAGQAPTRDTSGQGSQQNQQAAAGTGRISGRVLTVDTGSPVRGARVSLSAAQSQGRSIVTDNSGLFNFAALPAGRYTLSVSKTGFITLAYGQRRPMQQGTPLQLSDGQRLEGIEMRLPRGSAIAGRIVDENGDPLPNTVVRVMRYQYQQGERRLTPAGNGQTDDRGQYRVWGLNPGDYYVTAVMPNLGNMLDQLAGRGGPPPVPAGRGAVPVGPGGQVQAAAGRGARGAAVAAAPGGRGFPGAALGDILSNPAIGDALANAGLGNALAMFGDPNTLDGVAYAPTYYPGVSSANEARPITVGLGDEQVGIDFALLLVRTSQISGRVITPDGSPAVNGNVTLTADNGMGRGGGPVGGNFNGRILQDGSFAIANVPPGRYMLRARNNPNQGGGRGGRGGPPTPTPLGQTPPAPPQPQFGSQPIMVAGDMTDLMVSLMPGATVSGTVVLPPSAAGAAPNMNQIRVQAQATDSTLGTNIAGQTQADGRFTLNGVPAGTHWFRGTAPRGMTLKSVMIGGRDVIDDPYEIRGGETIDNVVVTFTDRVSEINGTITDTRGTPITDYTILAFPEDSRLWRPQARQIMTSRPDQTGKFQIRGLPPGRYYLAAVDPAVAGEWFEPAFLEQNRMGAMSLSLSEGETKTQDFRMR